MENPISQEVMNRFKQELKGENEEFINRIIRDYSARMSRIAWKNSQTHCKFDDKGFVLMPDNTRLYYRKGNTEVIIQEFNPCIRLLKFKGDLFNKNASKDIVEKEKSEEIKYFSLALPYVDFVFKFVEGKFFKLKCFFGDRPLKNLTENPVKPFLPNIDAKFDVCLGRSFDYSRLITNDVFQQSSYVLDHFWNSTFINESASHFWDSLAAFKLNDKINSLDAWEKSSIEDPLFVINEVNWTKISNDSFGDIISEFLSDDKLDRDFQQSIFDDISKEIVKEISDTISKNIDNIQKNFLK